jgi:hypothetical protein
MTYWIVDERAWSWSTHEDGNVVAKFRLSDIVSSPANTDEFDWATGCLLRPLRSENLNCPKQRK